MYPVPLIPYASLFVPPSVPRSVKTYPPACTAWFAPTAHTKARATTAANFFIVIFPCVREFAIDQTLHFRNRTEFLERNKLERPTDGVAIPRMTTGTSWRVCSVAYP